MDKAEQKGSIKAEALLRQCCGLFEQYSQLSGH